MFGMRFCRCRGGWLVGVENSGRVPMLAQVVWAAACLRVAFIA